MRVIDCEQGSPEWLQARLGIPTASCFDKLLTPTGQVSTQAGGYAHTLIAEWLCGEPIDNFSNQWTDRGTEMEPQARAYYAMQTNAEVQQVGFIVRDDGKAGCSPDGLIADDGMLEIKVPAPHTHVAYLLTGKVPTKYFSQVQGQLFVAERAWCDFLSYHPLLPPVLVRVHRDEKHIAALAREIDALHELIKKLKAQLAKQGITQMEKAA